MYPNREERINLFNMLTIEQRQDILKRFYLLKSEKPKIEDVSFSVRDIDAIKEIVIDNIMKGLFKRDRNIDIILE